MMLRSSLRPRTVRVLASLAGICGIQPIPESSAAPQVGSSNVAATLSSSSAAPPFTPAQVEQPVKLEPTTKYPWKTNIVGTIFWVGELATPKNPVPNTASSWDPKWMRTFGGFDDPDVAARVAGYRPAGFIPKMNPFYVALPYNDCSNYNATKVEAARMIPWFKDAFTREGKSVCENRWIAIRHNGRTCYAQWSDCGPFVTNDAAYVFGNARPTNTKNQGAGIDLAPAVRDYLGFTSGKTCDWRFVDESEVPAGPWRDYGRNNPFSLASTVKKAPASTYVATSKAKTQKQKASTKVVSRSATATRSNAVVASTSSGVSQEASARLDELRRQRDLWFQENGIRGVSR